MNENEKQLIDHLNTLWKRKWLITIPTLILMIAVGMYSFFMPKLWEVDVLIQPSKFLAQSGAGRLDEVYIINPQQIVEQINRASYNRLIGAELNLNISDFPKLEAEIIRNTKLIRISIRENDVEKAKLILYSIFNHLKKEFDKKIDIEIKSIDTQIAKNEHLIKMKNLDIQSKEIEKSKLRQEIISAHNKLKISEERYMNIAGEMKAVKERIDEIEKQQRKALSEKKQEGEALSLLLYSNEIQQNLRYYNTLNEKLSNEKIMQENLRLEDDAKEKDIKQLNTQIEKLRQEIEDIKNQIELLNENKVRIDYTQLIKEPTFSPSPVSPQKKLNVFIAGILGLTIFTTLAFFLEYIKEQKSKS